MGTFMKRDISSVAIKPYDLIGKGWFLITAGTPQDHNTMTASWGMTGVLWGKNVVCVAIRPQRYTFGYVDKGDTFTLSFFHEEHRRALSICGSKSGRDCDKEKEAGLTSVTVDGHLTYEEAYAFVACKKLYCQDIDPAMFIDPSLDNAHYPQKDYHRMFIAEITDLYVK